jgi:16S rRNA (guanine966-N2)-methyltransferase
MRVITGSAKGNRLKAPKGMTTRPTTDRVKESLFNILGSIPCNATILDLFAGSGGLGIEALSRGAKIVTFIDKSQVSCQVIRENLAVTGLLPRAEVCRYEMDKALEILNKQGKVFSLIFSDPPYMEGLALKSLRKVNELKLVVPGGIMVVEHSRREPLDDSIGNFVLSRRQHYGDTTISIYIYHEGEI